MSKAEKRKQWREHIPPMFNESYRKMYDKAINKKSMRAAVNSKCLDCVCWQQAEVKRCNIVTCPLYEYRPYQSALNQSNPDDSTPVEA
ncbi:MAG: hypothetical protein ACUZ9M_00715 [Candidatus Scalindua sp.]